MCVPTSGIEITGRSLSGMRRRCGTPGCVELGERDLVDLGDLLGIRVQRAGRVGPHDHGRDHEARARGVVVEAAEHGVLAQLEADLLAALAQRGLLGRLARVEPAARAAPTGRRGGAARPRAA